MRKNIIYKSLYKPILFVGCERLPFTLVTALGGIIMMSYQSLLVFVVVFILYTISVILIRRINESDPQFFLCLIRYVLYYRDYYRANEFYPGRIDIPYTFL